MQQVRRIQSAQLSARPCWAAAGVLGCRRQCGWRPSRRGAAGLLSLLPFLKCIIIIQSAL